MAWIRFAAETDGELMKLIEPMTLEEETDPTETETEDKPFDGSKLKMEYAYRADTVLPVKYTVSEILRRQEGHGVYPFVREKDRSSAALGTAIHAVMQYVDYSLRTEGEVEKAMDDMVSEGFLEREEREQVDARTILSVLRSPFMEEMGRYPCKREQPFMMYGSYAEGSEERVLVQGVIDLLVEKEDGYVVVDFKTGGGDAETLKDRYRKQLELYAKGVETILKKPVRRKVIYSVTGGFTVDV